MTNEQIKHMANRFLGWKLPADFSPDCGIHFDADAAKKMHPNNHRYEPIGTNLLSATQAEAMVRYMADGLPYTERKELDGAGVAVEQVDRDAAADLYLAMEGEPHSPFDAAVSHSIRMGNNDHWDAVQAFVSFRHRLSATTPPEPEPVEELEELDPDIRRRLESVCDTLEGSNNSSAIPIGFHQLAHAIRAALTAQRGLSLAKEGVGEAVAWLYDGPDGEHYIREHRDSGHNWLVRNGWTETPLYALAGGKTEGGA